MHGVWMQSSYQNLLLRNRSIVESSRLAPSSYTILNVDTKQFLSDSLPFTMLNVNDFKSYEGCFYFYRNKETGRYFIEVESRHPVIGQMSKETLVGFGRTEFDDLLILNQKYEGGISDKERFVRVSKDVRPKFYKEDPLIGVEIFARQFIQGTYNIYNSNNKLLMRNIELHPDGTIGNHPFAKYRMLAWTGFDALMIEGLPIVEEQQRDFNRYFGLKIKGNNLELYRIVKDKDDNLVLGNLIFVLRK